MIHWKKGLQPGMAYVMLGRTSRLQDIYIVESSDKFDPKDIRVSEHALNETKRLNNLFAEMKAKEEALFQDNFTILPLKNELYQ